MINIKGNLNTHNIKKIILKALILRIMMLVIVSFSGRWEQSFVGHVASDDWKYEQGAILFQENAKNLLDISTFTWSFNTADSLDYIGYHLDQPFKYAALWYFIVCLLVWIFKTKYSIRILNIILSAVSLKYIYDFARRIWGDNVAVKATKLYAFLPYSIIFCCFGYKEELVLFCTFFLLSYSVRVRGGEKLSFWQFTKLLMVSVILLGIRSGISLVLLGICVVIMYVQPPSIDPQRTIKRLLPLFLSSLIGLYLLARFWSIIIYKANYYFAHAIDERNGLRFLSISKIWDIWRLFFSYIYSIFMPIDVFREINSWYDLICNVNLCLIPISVGAALYIFIKNKPNKIVYWGTFLYYLIYVFTSLAVPRHYFALMPLNCIYFSAYRVASKPYNTIIMCILSIFLIIAVLFYFFLKNIWA